jgi:ribosome-associated translation inhibitor RaiA
MDIKLTNDGQVEITTKQSAREYIDQKLMTIDMLTEQIGQLQVQMQKEIDEIKNLKGEK